MNTAESVVALPIAQWARRYVSLGLHPIALHGVAADGRCTCGRSPCAKDNKSAGKHPVAAGWDRAPLDTDALYRTLESRPQLNIGLRMGRQPDGSCRVALDIDDMAAFAARAAELGALPPTFATQTSKGFHAVYEVAADVLERLTNFTKRDGVDARVEGGQIVAPPSRHQSGATYLPFGDSAQPRPVALPGPWVEWLLANSKPRPVVHTEPDDAPPLDDRWEAQARELLMQLPVATPGDGGKLMVAAALVGKGLLLPRETTDRLLREVYNPRCPVPWELSDPEDLRNWNHRIDDGYDRSMVEWGSKRPLKGLDGHFEHPDQLLANTAAPPERPDPRMMAAPEAWLAWMNSHHTALTCIGGKFRVLSWVRNSLGWRATVLSSVDDFKLRYAPLRAFIEGVKDEEGNPKPVEVAKWWLQQIGRDEALTLCFRPDRKERIVDGQLNMWEGYGCEPRRGSWVKMRTFIRDIAADGDPVADDYIFRWMAWVVQNPGARAEVVLVLKGAKGTGKNTLFDALCELFGKHGKTVANPKHLTGNFNSHLQDTALLFANEAIPPNDKGAESILKALVTDKSIAIERKGVDAEMVRNSLSVGMASNETWCVPASIDERRFAVFQVSKARRGDERYFGEIHAELETGGREAMLHDLLAFDLAGWHPRAHVPKTKPLVEQQLESLRGAQRIVYQMLAAGEWQGVVTAATGRPGYTFVSTRWVGKAAGKDATHDRGIGLELAACCEPDDRLSVKHNLGFERVRGRWMPSMSRARQLWAEHHGLTVEWDQIIDD